jgi:predicted membrane-bound dolichyl-phosphate-mannose-protein mannosyltransferase
MHEGLCIFVAFFHFLLKDFSALRAIKETGSSLALHIVKKRQKAARRSGFLPRAYRMA